MPRGFMLVRFDGDWPAARAEIIKCQSDSELAKLGAIIHFWIAPMGSSDIGVSVYGVSLESIRSAAEFVRARLVKSAGQGVMVSTTTVTGSTVREQFEPLEYAKSAVEARLKDLSGASSVDHIRQREAIRCYLQEEADCLDLVMAGFPKALSKTEQKALDKLREALVDYVKIAGLNVKRISDIIRTTPP